MPEKFDDLARQRLVEIFDANDRAALHEVRELFRQRTGKVIGDTQARQLLRKAGRNVNRRVGRKSPKE